MDNNSNPFDEKELGIQPQDDNAPIFLPDAGGQDAPWTGDHPSITPVIEKRKGWINPLMAIIGFVILAYFLVMVRSDYVSKQKASATQTALTATQMAVTQIAATQMAWVKPLASPSVGSVEEAKQTVKAGDIPDLKEFVFDYPDIPDINQPGDIYIFNVNYTDEPATWTYGWCATTSEILDDNFKHMEVTFIINQSQVSSNHLYIDHTEREDDSPCWTYVALLNSWPDGVHRLDIQVAFTEPVDDGWNTYPKGAHIFRYFVTVQP